MASHLTISIVSTLVTPNLVSTRISYCLLHSKSLTLQIHQKFWNNLSAHVKSATHLLSFKLLIKPGMAFLVNVTHVRSYKTINILVNNLGYTEVFQNTRSSVWDWAFFRKCEYLFTFQENASFLMLSWVSECSSVIHT